MATNEESGNQSAPKRSSTTGRKVTGKATRPTRSSVPLRAESKAALATVRVQTGTRDQLNAAAKEQGTTVDVVIQQALSAMRFEADMEQAAEEMRAFAEDPADRAEVARAAADLLGFEA